MQQRTITLAAVLALLAAAAYAPRAEAVTADELTFAQLRGANTSRQWTLQLSQGNLATPGVFAPINCTNNAVGACVSAANPPLQQVRSLGMCIAQVEVHGLLKLGPYLDMASCGHVAHI
jgi:hypothetical protein